MPTLRKSYICYNRVRIKHIYWTSFATWDPSNSRRGYARRHPGQRDLGMRNKWLTHSQLLRKNLRYQFLFHNPCRCKCHTAGIPRHRWGATPPNTPCALRGLVHLMALIVPCQIWRSFGDGSCCERRRFSLAMKNSVCGAEHASQPSCLCSSRALCLCYR